MHAIREEKKFSNVDELKQQISLDVAYANDFLSG